MSQNISRMYASHDQALKAANDLRNSRFARFTSVNMVSHNDAPEAGIDAIAMAVMKGYVLKSQAKVYAQGIQRGGSLVTVNAPFGTAIAAMQIMDQHGPIDSGVVEPKDRLPAWDDATPVSCALNLPVLLDNDASFSAFWSLPLLIKRSNTVTPSRATSSAPFTGTFGMALLSSKATILSSLFGLPVLLKR